MLAKREGGVLVWKRGGGVVRGGLWVRGRRVGKGGGVLMDIGGGGRRR